jgi:hypothetical protein
MWNQIHLTDEWGYGGKGKEGMARDIGGIGKP